VAHQILVSITENIVTLCAVPGKIKGRVLEDGDKVGQSIDLVFAAAKLGVIIEVRHVGELVGARQRTEDLFVDLVADVGFAFEGNHVAETCTGRNGDFGKPDTGIFIADILYKEQDEDIVLILAGIHASAQFVAALPEGGIEFGFLEGHTFVGYF
jgi:hypothetical protein